MSSSSLTQGCVKASDCFCVMSVYIVAGRNRSSCKVFGMRLQLRMATLYKIGVWGSGSAHENGDLPSL